MKAVEMVSVPGQLVRLPVAMIADAELNPTADCQVCEEVYTGSHTEVRQWLRYHIATHSDHEVVVTYAKIERWALWKEAPDGEG